MIPVAAVGKLVVMGVVFVAGRRQLSRYASSLRVRDDGHRALIDSLRKLVGTSPILFESPLDLYVVTWYAPDLVSRCHQLDFEAHELGYPDHKYLAHRDHIRIATRYFPVPGNRRWDTVAILPEFYLVADSEHAQTGTNETGLNYPGFKKTALESGVYLLTPENLPRQSQVSFR